MNESEQRRYLALRVMMMPRDTNPYGTIFGGVILSYIDQAGAIGARHELDSREFIKEDLVTVAMDRVEFHQPVFVGDAVSFWTSLIRIGESSIAMRIIVEAHRRGDSVVVTQADVTYVAVRLGESDRRVPTPLRQSDS